MKNKRNNRRGFTIVELVISLSVIVLVSVAAISVVSVNNKVYRETVEMIEATNVAENAIECFRYGHNVDSAAPIDDFEAAFAATFNADDLNVAGIQKPDTGDYTTVYTLSIGTVEMTITISADGNSMTVFASSDLDEELINKTYTHR